MTSEKGDPPNKIDIQMLTDRYPLMKSHDYWYSGNSETIRRNPELELALTNLKSQFNEVLLSEGLTEI